MLVMQVAPSALNSSTEERSTTTCSSISFPSQLSGAEILGTEKRLWNFTSPVVDVRFATIIFSAPLISNSRYWPLVFSRRNVEFSFALTVKRASYASRAPTLPSAAVVPEPAIA